MEVKKEIIGSMDCEGVRSNMLEIPCDLRLHVYDNLFNCVREHAKMIHSVQLLCDQTKVCLNESPFWMKPYVHQRNKMTMVSTDALFAICGAVTCVNVADPASVNYVRKTLREMIYLMRQERMEYRKIYSLLMMVRNQFEHYWEVHSTRLKISQDVKANVGILSRPMLKAQLETVNEDSNDEEFIPTPKKRGAGGMFAPGAPMKKKKNASLGDNTN